MQDVKRLNAYFVDKEEEVIIWLQQLDEQLSSASTLRDRQICHIGYIHLHGQLVLLFHWSMLNYAALVKILKKHGAPVGLLPIRLRSRVVSAPFQFSSWILVCALHLHPARSNVSAPCATLPQADCLHADKVSGREIKAPVLSNALKQPFSTTGMLSSLMAKCEAKARELEELTGGLESLLKACPEYQGLFLVKCACPRLLQAARLQMLVRNILALASSPEAT